MDDDENKTRAGGNEDEEGRTLGGAITDGDGCEGEEPGDDEEESASLGCGNEDEDEPEEDRDAETFSIF